MIVIQCTNIFALPRLPCAFSFIFGPRDKEKIMDSWLHHTTNFQNRLLNIYLSSLFPLLPSTVFFFCAAWRIMAKFNSCLLPNCDRFHRIRRCITRGSFRHCFPLIFTIFFPFPELVTIFFSLNQSVSSQRSLSNTIDNTMI